eukprot:CAMPEP_0117041422 /NCGR_PEP_ID=MMETSP0472-20121206/28928_1 /TAXON_ID=693140 ORGANISM="Tiarina fusus, Strain LIS" /NCGR_SAMPLE_ID=MMETSP0472 /ASSEMBLY_ACC=CAM_ASM_000603 /LENGTH=83 /DNA_ID=CAMNT_0004752427 /DNA_START=101 /DNA_END=352 /DNA_ORIENTATION=+
MMGETEGLASVVRTVRQGVLGKLIGKRTASGFPKPVNGPVAPSTFPADATAVSQEAFGGFDADSYRREMRDLVYQRSMQRFSE